MNILKSLNQLSFAKLTTITLFVGFVLVLPISIIVFNQQTRTTTVAKFDKPEPIDTTKAYGFPSAGDPQISLVWPFLGKIGDTVLIYGNNLGDNPLDKTLKVGNQFVSEQDIIKWTPNLIEFNIPKSTVSGSISIRVANKDNTWLYPFTVYGLDTKTQVMENNNILRVLNGPPDGTAVLFFEDGTKLETKEFKGANITSSQKIISVLVKDKAGNAIPFFVEPAEFGF
ncbi:IPT/TIG domain-containing protein [Patescibacteria group bacterium]